MMKINRSKVVMLAVLSMVMIVSSCKKKGCIYPEAENYSSTAEADDGSCIFDESQSSSHIKSGYITSDETWTPNNIYELQGKVIVQAGVTLTIMPGTIVKGWQGTGTDASALIVEQGAMINACGTSTAPIIFTSILDNIGVGELTGTNLDENDSGLWGGILIMGNAPVSAGDGDVVSQIEGIPASETYGAFGGSNPADNSGSLCYVSIRHGGALIGAGNEINGLTLGGVGTGTTINNIEIVANVDDGIEFFGGTVNVTDLLIGFQGDDGVDIDMNYSGTVSNFTVINGAGSDEGLEIDGPEGTTNTTGYFTLQDGTVRVYGGGNGRGDFKSKAQGNINNVKMGEAKIRVSYQNDCVDPKVDAWTHLTQVSPTLIFTGSEFTMTTVYTGSEYNVGGTCPVIAQDQTDAENAMTSTTATGSDETGFASWTWCGVNGKL